MTAMTPQTQIELHLWPQRGFRLPSPRAPRPAGVRVICSRAVRLPNPPLLQPQPAPRWRVAGVQPSGKRSCPMAASN